VPSSLDKKGGKEDCIFLYYTKGAIFFRRTELEPEPHQNFPPEPVTKKILRLRSSEKNFSGQINFTQNLHRFKIKETGHLWPYYIYMTVLIRNAANLAYTLLKASRTTFTSEVFL
jgi:hypothetical protein